MTTPRQSPLRSHELLERLQSYPRAQRYLVGFSGGADSTALLTALSRCREQVEANIEAVHFDHGLHPDSSKWVRHCERFCEEREIPFSCHRLDLSADVANLESRARTERYRLVEEMIDPDTLYLTAHHAEDRAETLLLHAMRGSGIDGLASIPEIRPLGSGQVARPLLRFSRDDLAAYLQHHGIDWIEDPANQDARMDRNYIRRHVIPVFESRWPAARLNLARSAAHLDLANTVLRKLLRRHIGNLCKDREVLPVEVLFSLGTCAATLVIREWLREKNAPPPPQARLEEFLDQIAKAGTDAQCEIIWGDVTLRLFRDEIHFSPDIASEACPVAKWNGSQTIELGNGLGALRLCGPGTGTAHDWVVGPRQAGDRFRLHAAGPRRKLKKVMQEQPIPPWHRDSIPVLYWSDHPVAVGDWLYAPEFADWLERRRLQYRWSPASRDLVTTRTRCHSFVSAGRDA